MHLTHFNERNIIGSRFSSLNSDIFITGFSKSDYYASLKKKSYVNSAFSEKGHYKWYTKSYAICS